MDVRLLIVQRPGGLRAGPCSALAALGWEVDQAGSVERALQILAVHPPDVVLVDLELPGIGGPGVCRLLRDRGAPVLIAMSEGRSAGEVVASLTAGADDHVSRLVPVGELVARIRAQLRRRRAQLPAATAEVLRAGHVEIHMRSGLVRSRDATVHLTAVEHRLLVELASARGRVVTRDELLRRVWGHLHIGDSRLLDVHVHRLRHKIERDPARPECVITVRGRGYRTPVAGTYPAAG